MSLIDFASKFTDNVHMGKFATAFAPGFLLTVTALMAVDHFSMIHVFPFRNVTPSLYEENLLEARERARKRKIEILKEQRKTTKAPAKKTELGMRISSLQAERLPEFAPVQFDLPPVEEALSDRLKNAGWSPPDSEPSAAGASDLDEDLDEADDGAEDGGEEAAPAADSPPAPDPALPELEDDPRLILERPRLPAVIKRELTLKREELYQREIERIHLDDEGSLKESLLDLEIKRLKEEVTALAAELKTRREEVKNERSLAKNVEVLTNHVISLSLMAAMIGVGLGQISRFLFYKRVFRRYLAKVAPETFATLYGPSAGASLFRLELEAKDKGLLRAGLLDEVDLVRGYYRYLEAGMNMILPVANLTLLLGTVAAFSFYESRVEGGAGAALVTVALVALTIVLYTASRQGYVDYAIKRADLKRMLIERLESGGEAPSAPEDAPAPAVPDLG